MYTWVNPETPGLRSEEIPKEISVELWRNLLSVPGVISERTPGGIPARTSEQIRNKFQDESHKEIPEKCQETPGEISDKFLDEHERNSWKNR